jgi:hypothetical protein
MSDRGIAADQQELSRCRILAESLKQPEHALHSHIHDGFGDLFAGGEMNDMRHAGPATTARSAMGRAISTRSCAS